MDDTARRHASQALLDAYASKTPIAPLTETYENVSVDDAYAIQLMQIETFIESGRTIKGHKVGLTSAAMQKMLGVDKPDYGHLVEDFFYLEHLPIPTEVFLQPRVEPEIAFVLKRSLQGPGVTVAEAIASVDFVIPALEIVDSRIAEWKISLVDTIADNASSGAVVLGSTPKLLRQVDLRLTGAVMTCDGQIMGTGTGGAVLGSPINSLVWLANTVGTRGVALEVGHVILPGALCGMVPVRAGDTISASFAGLGSVTANFTSDGGDA